VNGARCSRKYGHHPIDATGQREQSGVTDHGKPEENVPLGFNLYCSVSPDEMQAFQRVVGAARELCVVSVSDDGRDGGAASGIRSELRDRATTELAEALSVLDAVRTRRTGSDGAGSLAPWLDEYLRRSERRSRTTGWRPADFEPPGPLASPTSGQRDAA
jgi:hypothetical protein